MKSSIKLISIATLFILAGAAGIGCARAGDKDAKKPDDAIRWETPASTGEPSAGSVSAPASASAMNPYAAEDDLQSLWEEMNRMHRSMIDSMSARGWSGGMGLHRPMSVSSYSFTSDEMHADVAETAKEYIITCELPGVPKDRIQIQVDGSVLLVRAVRDSGADRSGEENGQKYHYRERSYGTTERRFRVGSGVDPKKIKASLKDGVLTLRVPKGEDRTVQVPIEG